MLIRSYVQSDLARLTELTIETFRPFYEESFRPLVGELIARQSPVREPRMRRWHWLPAVWPNGRRTTPPHSRDPSPLRRRFTLGARCESENTNR